MRYLFFLCSFLSCSAFASTQITGAGSSFIAPVMYQWTASYSQKTHVQVNYQSMGSGAGIKQVEGSVVDFGATDMPLKQEELQKNGLTQFPLVIGGIVIVTNVVGTRAGELILDATTLALIYSGEIKDWNDPRIAALNPTLTLPKTRIVVVYRADGSGTTFNFTSYLQNAAPQVWHAGSGTSVSWPKSILGVGGTGNEGVTSFVKRVPGAIGYVEYTYAFENKLNWSRLKNKQNKVVPNIAKDDLANSQKVKAAFEHSFQAAASHAQWEASPAMDVLLVNQPGQETWPLTAATFAVMHRKSDGKKDSKALQKFFHFVYTEGAQQAQGLNYVPISKKTYDIIEARW